MLWLRNRHKNLPVVGAESLEDADFARFLDDESNLITHDAERRRDHDEKQQEEHHVLLRGQGVENVRAFLLPGPHGQAVGRSGPQLPGDFVRQERIAQLDLQGLHGIVRQGQEFARVVQRSDDELIVEIGKADVKNAAHRKIFAHGNLGIGLAGGGVHFLQAFPRPDGDAVAHVQAVEARRNRGQRPTLCR